MVIQRKQLLLLPYPVAAEILTISDHLMHFDLYDVAVLGIGLITMFFYYYVPTLVCALVLSLSVTYLNGSITCLGSNLQSEA